MIHASCIVLRKKCSAAAAICEKRGTGSGLVALRSLKCPNYETIEFKSLEIIWRCKEGKQQEDKPGIQKSTDLFRVPEEQKTKGEMIDLQGQTQMRLFLFCSSLVLSRHSETWAYAAVHCGSECATVCACEF